MEYSQDVRVYALSTFGVGSECRTGSPLVHLCLSAPPLSCPLSALPLPCPLFQAIVGGSIVGSIGITQIKQNFGRYFGPMAAGWWHNSCHMASTLPLLLLLPLLVMAAIGLDSVGD